MIRRRNTKGNARVCLFRIPSIVHTRSIMVAVERKMSIREVILLGLIKLINENRDTMKKLKCIRHENIEYLQSKTYNDKIQSLDENFWGIIKDIKEYLSTSNNKFGVKANISIEQYDNVRLVMGVTNKSLNELVLIGLKRMVIKNETNIKKSAPVLVKIRNNRINQIHYHQWIEDITNHVKKSIRIQEKGKGAVE